MGMRPIVLERGKDVHQRRKDIARISREHIVDDESNYCFGEGGAGAFSDGKLYTRSKKRGSVDRILSILCQHGASLDILSDAHPHIGTDKLPRVIENIRHTILESGGEVKFGTRIDELIFDKQEVIGAKSHTGEVFAGPLFLQPVIQPEMFIIICIAIKSIWRQKDLPSVYGLNTPKNSSTAYNTIIPKDEVNIYRQPNTVL